MTGPSTDIGRDLAVFVDPQTSFDSAASSNLPAAADAVRVITASVNGKSPFALFEDKRGSSTAFGVINQKRTAEWSLECYASVTTRGTAPDWIDLITSGGWQLQSDRSATTTTVSGGDTDEVQVASSSGFVVGDAVIIETGNGTGAYEIRRLTAIDDGGANRISVSPDLQNTPASGANVKGALMYKPYDDRDTTPAALTVWAFNNNSADRAIGGVVGSNSFTLGGDEAARVTFSGTARQDNRMGQTALNGGIGDGVTDIDIDSGVVIPSDASSTIPYYYQIDDEVIKVIGVAANVITVATRGVFGTGGAAAAHLTGALVFPYQPAGTYAGTPVPATSGQLIVEGSAFEAGTISVEVDQGIIYRENVHGSAYVVDGYVGGKRAVTATLEGWSFYDSTMIQALNARDRTSVSVLAQQGEAESAILAIELPTFYIEEPDMDRGGDEVTVSLSGQAVGSAAETEVYLMIG